MKPRLDMHAWLKTAWASISSNEETHSDDATRLLQPADTIIGTPGNDNLVGTLGDDTINGGAGADTMVGGDGNDTYIVDSWRDEIQESADQGVDTVIAYDDHTMSDHVENLTMGRGSTYGIGNDLDNVIRGGKDYYEIHGNAGNDTIDGANGDGLITGGDGDDVIYVRSFADTDGGAGNDRIEVRDGGHDGYCRGGDGDDTLYGGVNGGLGGGDGNDLLKAGSGDSYASGDAGEDTLLGAAGSANRLSGGDDDDLLVGGKSGDLLYGQSGNDRLYGRGGVDRLDAEFGEDLLDGGAGDDWLSGGYGNDTLRGGAGDDRLSGGALFDTMVGGGGADVFHFDDDYYYAADAVLDFVSGIDTILIDVWMVPIGDGDRVVENAVTVAGPGGFDTSAELVIVTADIDGPITSVSAARAIGSANSDYAVGDSVLFVVDNGIDTGVFHFKSEDGDAVTWTSELRPLALLEGTATTTAGDYMFGY